MAPLLVLHLGAVLAFFVTVPYGKFVHGFYRLLALVWSGHESASSGGWWTGVHAGCSAPGPRSAAGSAAGTRTALR
jgi:hypothetical protein